MTEYKQHLFICTNEGSEKATCGGKGSKKLRDDLKDSLQKKISKKDLRINQAGCLGHCNKGITAVLYPQGQWFFNLKKTDLKKLEKEILKNIKNEEA